ncbi:hypothetical protein SO802_010850 [Lithocarpus litseifolius]|uniref:Uncharacterized protein n=1 Tax=Lithocarpus litseifolius TaxID=425828 RepID=A0AAW2DFC7_9ROSI
MGEVLEVDFTSSGGCVYEQILKDTEVQSKSKEPFGFGPWLKAEAASSRASRWVEFIVDSNQASDEEDVGRKESVAQEQEESSMHLLKDVGTKETQVAGSKNNLTRFENLADYVTSKHISLSNCPSLPTQSQPVIQPDISKPTNLTSLSPMETDSLVAIKQFLSTQSESRTISKDSRILHESPPPPSIVYNPSLVDSGLNDPSLLIGPFKAQNNVLSWTAYYNEGGQPVHVSSEAQSNLALNQIKVFNRRKRKLEEVESPANLRALKLTKVGSGLLKLDTQSNSYNQLCQNKTMGRSKVNRKKKIKELAREHATLVPCNSSQEVISFNPVTFLLLVRLVICITLTRYS